MTAKTGEKKVAAFLKALAETGNQTIAAERAKVSRSWVGLRRGEDPAFRAAMGQAIAAAKARLNRAAGVGPAPGWRTQDGEELTVRGSNGRWTQVARARPRQWTPRLEARFLASLATNCNVKLACAAVGLSQQSAYGHRKRWAAFAERWDQAIEDGYDRLATAVVASAGAMLGDDEMAPEVDMGPIGFEQAIRLLGIHQRRAIGLGRMPGRAARVKPLDDAMRASIWAKLEMVERACRAEEAQAQRRGGRR